LIKEILGYDAIGERENALRQELERLRKELSDEQSQSLFLRVQL